MKQIFCLSWTTSHRPSNQPPADFKHWGFPSQASRHEGASTPNLAIPQIFGPALLHDALKVGLSRMHKVLASLCIVQSSFINSSCNAMSFCHSAWERIICENGLVLLFGVFPAYKKRDLIKLKVCCGSESNFDVHLSFCKTFILQPHNLHCSQYEKKGNNEWV